MEISLEAMAIEMPHVDGHPNRLPFRGVLTLVDVPSDHPPSGAGKHRVILTRTAAEKALPSLLGMALDFKPNLDGHDARMKVGVVTSADIRPVGFFRPGADSSRPEENPHSSPKEGRGWGTLGTSAHQLEIGGYIFAKDFPDIVDLIRGSEDAEPTPSLCSGQALRQHQAKDGAPELGMSYELTNVIVADSNAPIWVLTSATFTGAAMLLRHKAAYGGTWIELDSTAIEPLAIGH